MITGTEQPDGGTIRLGDSVKVATVDQSRGARQPVVPFQVWAMYSAVASLGSGSSMADSDSVIV